jgi:hypothetical protein
LRLSVVLYLLFYFAGKWVHLHLKDFGFMFFKTFTLIHNVPTLARQLLQTFCQRSEKAFSFFSYHVVALDTSTLYHPVPLKQLQLALKRVRV